MSASVTDFGRRPLIFVDLLPDRCTRTYGTAPCTASGAHGSECYNTYATCQDQANYAVAATTVRLLPKDAPIAITGLTGYRCITKISTVSTVIDEKAGLAPRGTIEIECTDFDDDDGTIDPYVRHRTDRTPRPFFRRFAKRNPNYADRWLLIREGFLEADGSAYVTGFSTRRYIITGIVGPDRNRRVRIQAKDPLAQLEKIQIPVANDGELVAGISAVATSFSFKSGQGAQYSASAFYVRIGDEILYVGSRSGDACSSVTRAQKGTTAEAHAADDKVQEAWSPAGSVATVWQDILVRGGVDVAYIDTVGAAAQDKWIGSYVIDATLTKPASARDRLRDLMVQCSCLSWWDAEAQLVRLLAIRPLTPYDSPTALDQARTSEVEVIPQPADRLTRQLMFIGVYDWSDDLSKPEAYTRAVLPIDASAEGAFEGGKVRAGDAIYAYYLPASQLLNAQSAMRRLVNNRRNTPVKVKLRLDALDASALVPGSPIALTSDELVDNTGAPSLTYIRLTGKRQLEHGHTVYEYEGIVITAGPYAYFAPASSPAATYPRFCNASGKLSDGVTSGSKFG